MVAADEEHRRAAATWNDLLDRGEDLLTSNYVLLETYAILQRRFGLTYVDQLRRLAVPAMSVHWVTAEQHDASLSAVLAANRRDLSLVDCTSFVVMRDLHVERVFSLGPHFAEQGFQIV